MCKVNYNGQTSYVSNYFYRCIRQEYFYVMLNATC